MPEIDFKIIKKLGIVKAPIKYFYHKTVNSSHIKALANIDTAAFGKLPEAVIYCIHGTASLPRCFTGFNQNLANELNQQHKNYIIRTPEFQHRYSGESIEDYSRQLIKQIYNNHDQNKPIILIGHSRGGLIAAYIKEFLASDYHLTIRRVITIASPFKGCQAAKLPLPLTKAHASLHQMRKHSHFLQYLNAIINHNYDDYEHYIGTEDHVVKKHDAHPYQTQSWQIPLNMTVISGAHSTVLDNPELTKKIADSITDKQGIRFNPYSESCYASWVKSC